MGASYKARVRAYLRSDRGRGTSAETQRILLAISNEQLGLPADITAEEIHGVRMKLDAVLRPGRPKSLGEAAAKSRFKTSA